MRVKHQSHAGIARQWWVLVGSLLVGLSITVLNGCVVKKPQVPSTPFKVSIPVANNLTTVEELATTHRTYSDYLSLEGGGDSLLAVDFSARIDTTVEVGDRLRLAYQGVTLSSRLAEEQIDVPSFPSTEIELPVETPGAVEEMETVPVEAQEFGGTTTVPTSLVENLLIESARLQVTVTNDTPVPVAGVELELLGGVASLSRVGPGASSTAVVDIAEQSIGRSLAVQYAGGTEPGEIAPDASFSITVDLVLDQLQVVVPPREFGLDNQSIDLPTDRIRVTTAELRSGTLAFEITNNTPLSINSLQLILHDLRKDNKELTVDVPTMEQGASVLVETPSLEGYVFDRTGKNPGRTMLSFQGRTGWMAVEVPATLGGTVDVQAIASELVFESVEGALDHVELPVEKVATRTVDFPQGLENLELEESWVAVYLTTNVGIASWVILDIEGENRAGASRRLSLEAEFSAVAPGEQEQIQVSCTSAALTEFLNLLPTEVRVTPRIAIGDGSQGSIRATHQVTLDSVTFLAPAVLAISDTTQIQPEATFQRIGDDEARGRIERNLIEASVRTEIVNHLPIGISLSFRVAPDSSEVYRDGTDAVWSNRSAGYMKIPATGAFSVKAADTDERGRVIRSASGKPGADLTAEDVKVFLRKEGVWTGVLINLAGTGGKVRVRAGDYVQVTAATQIIMELNEDLVETD